MSFYANLRYPDKDFSWKPNRFCYRQDQRFRNSKKIEEKILKTSPNRLTKSSSNISKPKARDRTTKPKTKNQSKRERREVKVKNTR